MTIHYTRLLPLAAAFFVFTVPGYCTWQDGGGTSYGTAAEACESYATYLNSHGYSNVQLASIAYLISYGYPSATCYLGTAGSSGSFTGGSISDVCSGTDVPDADSPSGCSPPDDDQDDELDGECDCGNLDGAVSSPGGGDPINIPSGNVFYETTDYSTAGANPLKFVRYYNSRSAYISILGTNWRSNFENYINILSGSQVEVFRADGKGFIFNLVGSTWTPNADVDYTLTLSGSITSAGSTWTLTAPDDKVETYINASTPTSAYLSTIVLRNGYTQTLSYSSGLLSGVTDSYGRSITFTLNSANQLASISTPDSTTISYAYTASDLSGLLSTVTFPTSPSTHVTYGYGGSSQPDSALTSITDENGHTFEAWTYDGYGRGLTNAQGGSGINANLVTLTYNDTTGSRTLTNALGVTDTYSFTTLQGVPKVTGISRASTSSTAAATESMSYDSNGFLSSFTDWNGNVTNTTNNSHGRPTQIVEGYGSTVARTTNITYDTTFVHLPASVATAGLTTSFTYQSGTGNVLTKTFTDTTTGSVPYSTNGQARTWTYTWTASNTLLNTIKTPNSHTTTLGYNSSGALTSVTDALSHATNITSVTGGGFAAHHHGPQQRDHHAHLQPAPVAAYPLRFHQRRRAHDDEQL